MIERTVHRARELSVARLRIHFARGELATGTFEQRLELALSAPSIGHAWATLWDLTRRRGRRIDGLLVPGAGELASASPRASWVVGRGSDCDRRLRADTVSRHHLRVTKRGGCWSVEDLGSTNGTFVNGRRIERLVLAPGDRIVLGEEPAAIVVEGAWRGRPAL